MYKSRVKSMYISNVDEINKLQKDIMLFITLWVRTYKKCTPQREIIIAMKDKTIKESTTLNALSVLLKKGYIRKSISYQTRFLEYTQLRTV